MRKLVFELEELGRIRPVRVSSDQAPLLVSPETVLGKLARVLGRRTPRLLRPPIIDTRHARKSRGPATWCRVAFWRNCDTLPPGRSPVRGWSRVLTRGTRPGTRAAWCARY